MTSYFPAPPAPDASNIGWAYYYLNLGWTPLPVKPGTKFPAVKWTEYQTRQPTPREIERWNWSGGIGIVTNGLICVDCDGGGEQLLKGKDFPPSWTVRTGSGGLHRYYKANGQRARNAAAILKEDGKGQVDIRADGGFIIVPPSAHIETGKPYTWILPPWLDTLPLAPAPAWIQDAVTDRDRPQEAKDQPHPTWVTELMQGVPEGQRNDAAARLAGYFCEKKHPEDITLEILRPFSERCRPPMPFHELQGAIASIYRTHHRRGGATGMEQRVASETTTEASDFEPAEVLWSEPDEPIEWDVEGIIVRNTQGWISARPRDGKSMLTTHIGSRLAAGRPVLDRYPILVPRRVLLVQEEDPRRRLKRRLKQLVSQEERDAWRGRFLVLIEAGLKLDDSKWQEWLIARIEKHKAEVLILDVWRWLHNADTNSEKELKPILTFLTDIRRRYGLTILIVTHDSKPKQGPEGSKHSTRITGSWAQWAWAHFGIFLKKTGRTVQVEVEGKDAQDASFAFRFAGGEDGQPLRLVWEPTKLSAGEERRRRLAQHLQEHPGEWVTLETLTSVAGVSEDTTRKDLDALCSESGFESDKMPFGRTRKRVYRYVDTPE
ncbi:MAG: bifunctional DNA primase/polymerase [Candidatus Methylomirabilales bacterium]|nr:bifunctional DNA primase/polymerase [candidate division NC10 bacterium]